MPENNNSEPPVTPPSTQGKSGSTPLIETNNNRYSGSIWGIVLCGVLGLVIGVYILLGWPFNNKNRFHEIDMNFHSADIVGLARLGEILEKKKADILSMTEKDAAEKKQKAKKLDSITDVIRNLNQAKFELTYGNADTVQFDVMKYSMRRDTFASMVSNYKASEGINLMLGYHDPTFSDTQFVVTNHVSQKDYASATTFFRKYPEFAFWAFLWLLQIVMWFLILPICIYLFGKIKELNTESGTQNRRGKSFLIAGISMIIFSLVLYEGIIDEFLITDKYFMRGFLNNVKIYSVIGYAISFLCLAGYLYIADFLHQLQNKFKRASDAYTKLVDEKKRNGNQKPEEIEQSEDVKQKADEKSTVKEQFARAKKYFNLFFGMTAAVLSVLVLCASSLYSSTNSLEVFRFYEHLSSHKYFSGDFVYLYGGIHTIILLIFVLPARFKIYDLNTSIPDLQDTDDAGKTASGVLKNVGKVIGEVLVVSSPLLASFVTNVINSLFN
jgi:hypothetical protein